MTNYQIVPKQDFGPYGYYDADERKMIRDGFVVTDGICNVMPGASWFRTKQEAEIGIVALKLVGDSPDWYTVFIAFKNAYQDVTEDR